MGGLEQSRVNYSELAWYSMPLPAWQMQRMDLSGGQGSFLALGHKAQLGLKWTLIWIKRLSSVPCPEWLFNTLSKRVGSEEDVLFSAEKKMLVLGSMT